jgi:hypothetical protein
MKCLTTALDLLTNSQEGLDAKDFLSANNPYPHLSNGHDSELMRLIFAHHTGRLSSEMIKNVQQAPNKTIIRDKIAFPLLCDIARFGSITIESNFMYNFLTHRSGSVSMGTVRALLVLQ